MSGAAIHWLVRPPSSIVTGVPVAVLVIVTAADPILMRVGSYAALVSVLGVNRYRASAR